MSKRVKLFTGALLLMAVGPCSPQQVLRNQNAAGIVDRSVIVPREQFDFNKALALAQQFLRANAGKYRLLRLTLGVDAVEVNRSLGHGQIHGTTYESTVEELKKYGMPKGPIARLLALGGNALFSYRDAAGLQERVTAGVRDPTKIRVGTAQYRLLHFIFSEGGVYGPEFDRSGACKNCYLRLFLMSLQRPSVHNCVALLRLLQRGTGLWEISIEVKTNSWFLDDPSYPDVHRFVPETPIPNPAEHMLSPWVGCSLIRGELSCSGKGFLP